MRGSERLEHLDARRGHDRPRGLPPTAPVRSLPLEVVHPVDPLHHQEVGAVRVVVEIVDLHDVRVLERGGHPRLLDEHRHEGGILGQMIEDALDRDLPAKARCPVSDGAENLRHPSLARELQELVLSSEPSSDVRIHVSGLEHEPEAKARNGHSHSCRRVLGAADFLTRGSCTRYARV